MAARKKRRSKRPPGGWIRSCIRKVKSRSVAVVDPSAVCGALWKRMSPSAKKRAKRKHPERKKGSAHGRRLAKSYSDTDKGFLDRNNALAAGRASGKRVVRDKETGRYHLRRRR